jgi:L-threonylcarbamoyladenylate synthase
MSTAILSPDRDSLARAGQALREGRLVAMPTETVYGLAASAQDGEAVARIFEAKGRPQFNPLIVHGADQTQIENLVDMESRARQIAKAFWPGPLTLILPKRGDTPVAELASAGLATLAVRVPGHEAARALIRAAGMPLAAPSANASGQLSPTTPEHVQQSLGEKVDMIIAGGAADIGLESTVLDLTGETPVILRPGAVTADDLAPLLGDVAYAGDGDSDSNPGIVSNTGAPRSPGQTLQHYAPHTPLRLDAVDVAEDEALLAFGSTRFMALRDGGHAGDLPDTAFRNLSDSGDLLEAAANLFRHLHALDRSGRAQIAVMPVPETGIGRAINDRLRRAAQ